MMTTDQFEEGATVATTTNDVEEIRRGMASIRQRLHQDVKGVYAGAEAASDWKHYYRMYPWAAVGGAFLLGYFIIPRKRRSVHQTAEKAAELAVAKVADTVQNAVANVPAPAPPPPPEPKKGWIGAAFGMVAPLALRAAQTYALSYVENYLAQQTQSQASGPEQVGPRAAR